MKLTSVVVGDFNGDKIPDVAVANAGSNTVSILVGNGDGTFRPAQNFFITGSAPRSIVVGDFDGDDRPDLAVANATSENVSILMNNTAPH